MASQQSLYYGNMLLADNDPAKWEVISCESAGSNGSYTTWQTRGIQSTVTLDGAGWKNYVIQGQADNRIAESWDNGISWTQLSRPAGGENGDYVDVIPANGANPALVITACGGGFTGANDGADASHWGKYLSDPPAPTDSWVSLETGTSGLPGPGSRTYGSAVDPADPKHVVLATQTGLYETTDIYARLAGTGGTFALIGPAGSYKGGDVWFDANDSGILFANTATALVKGEKTGVTWNFIQLATPTDDATYWHSSGSDYLAYSSGESLMLSADGGTTFTEVLNRSGILALYTAPWMGLWRDGSNMAFNIAGLAGYGDKLYCAVDVPYAKHEYLMLEGTIGSGGAVTWADWTGTTHPIEVPHLWDAKIVTQLTPAGTSAVYYYASSRGGGLWRREISNLSTALPIQTGSFEAIQRENQVHLHWAVAAGSKPLHFTLLRSSADMPDFQEIETMPAQSGQTTYNAYDLVPAQAQTLRYLIRQTDTDGAVSHSEIREVAVHPWPGLTVFPNPAQGVLYFSSYAPVEMLTIVGMDGKKILQQAKLQADFALDVSDLPSGLYTSYFYLENGSVFSQKIQLVNH